MCVVETLGEREQIVVGEIRSLRYIDRHVEVLSGITKVRVESRTNRAALELRRRKFFVGLVEHLAEQARDALVVNAGQRGDVRALQINEIVRGQQPVRRERGG